MAQDRQLPSWLGAVHPERKVPHTAVLAIGSVVAVIVIIADLRGSVGFSSFAVLVYYAIANVAALKQSKEERRWPRALQIFGVAGCLILAFSLSVASVLGGATVLVFGAVLWWFRHRRSDRRR